MGATTVTLIHILIPNRSGYYPNGTTGTNALGVILYPSQAHYLNLRTNTWSNLTSSTSTPSARAFHTWVLNENGSYAMMFGGWDTRQTYYNDIWVYDIVGRTWTNMSVTSSTLRAVPAMAMHSMIYNRKQDAFYVFGKLQLQVSLI